jgi:GDP-mannose 6-dehydrogenase
MTGRVAVIGLGHVGSVVAAGLARRGHAVVAVDRDAARVASVERGIAPVEEPGLADALAQARAAGALRATADVVRAIVDSRISLVCVGTPALRDGSVDLRDLDGAARDIALGLKASAGRHVVVVRSTVPPGTTRHLAVTLGRLSGRTPGKDFGVCANPEFLREGEALSDFEAAATVVIGETDRRDGDAVLALQPPGAAAVRVDPETAELIKYTHNAWNATRVAFANEIGALGAALGVDARAALTAFAANATGAIDGRYLRPGFPWGGACLGKDLAGLRRMAQRTGVAAPLLDAVAESNGVHMDRCVAAVLAHGARRIGIAGIAFKPRTGDVRDSPFLAFAQRLVDAGRDVRWHDPSVRDGGLAPAWSARRAASLPALVDACEAVVLCHRDAETRAAVTAVCAGRADVIDFSQPPVPTPTRAKDDAAAA